MIERDAEGKPVRFYPFGQPVVQRCHACKGTGTLHTTRHPQPGDSWATPMYTSCVVCEGTGFVADVKPSWMTETLMDER